MKDMPSDGSTGITDATPASATAGVTQRQLAINLITGGLGTGMLSLPWSMAGAGIIPGVLMTFAVVGLNAWTITILVEAAEAYQVFDLGGVLSMLPGTVLGVRLGRFMQSFTNAMVWVVLMGSLISYLIVMHDSAVPFLERSDALKGFSNRLTVVSVSALIVLPLCFLDQAWLSFTSTLGIAVNVYLIILLFVLFGNHASDSSLSSDACILGIGTGSLAMLSTLSQCVIIQMCVLPMYEELQDRTPAKFRRSLLIAFASLAVLFSVFATLGYLLYYHTGDVALNGNLLKNLPQESWWTNITQIGFIAVVAVVYPIMVIPMMAPIKNMDLSRFVSARATAATISQRRTLLVTSVTVFLVFLSWLGAYLVDDLGIVNVVDGALCVTSFTALAPGLVGLYLVERRSKGWRLMMYVLICLGVIFGIMGMVFNDNYADQLAKNCAIKTGGDHNPAQLSENLSGLHKALSHEELITSLAI
eukprot:TRINITY_DN121568_c0_g1_i1.p1 TRINITY_DN121568_c0_g1~~TRINITY_DN121568_c0_g1_i1.p1  ORF type:complete len:474 (+),score=88.93 TRINITY_DN121568_c0_g1_i1:74-1495(+)